MMENMELNYSAVLWGKCHRTAQRHYTYRSERDVQSFGRMADGMGITAQEPATKTLILKTFLFQFISCNAAIFYTTFVQADYSSAMMQIIGIVVSKQLIDFGKSLLVPMAFVHRRKRSLYNKIKLANEKALKEREARAGRTDNTRFKIAPTAKKRGSGLQASAQKVGISQIMDLFIQMDTDDTGTINCSDLAASRDK